MARVAITGADGQVGRALLERLQGTEAETFGLTRRPVNLPVTRSIAGPLESAQAHTSLKEADVVVHLAGTLRPVGSNSYETANVDTTRAVVRAVKEGQTKRILYLSYVGARDDSLNAYLRTKAVSERMLQEIGKKTVVFRCTHIVGTPTAPGPTAQALLAKPGKAVSVLGNGRQIVTPVYLGDVVSALVSAMQSGRPGTYDLAGPDRMTMDQLVCLLNRNADVSITHVPALVARLLGFILPGLPGALVDVLLKDSVGDSKQAVDAFRLTPTSLRTVWSEGGV